MKLRSLFEFVGFKSAPQSYGHRIDSFELEQEGTIRFAQWLHPKCKPRTFQQGEIDELRRYIAPGDAVIDVGAHLGDTTMLFALATGPQGRVFAVEPNRYVLPVLQRNAGLNPQAAPFTVLPYAATAQSMPLVFDYSDPGFCNGGDLSSHGRFRNGHLYKLDVEGRNIAGELAAQAPEWLPRIRFIKTDTEGNDAAVIETLRDVIASARPYLLCEVYKRSPELQRRAFHRLLTTELGYRVYHADPYAKLRGDELGADDMMRDRHFDVFCVPAERA